MYSLINLIFTSLILGLGASVYVYAIRFVDRVRRGVGFHLKLAVLIISLFMMVTADDVRVFLVSLLLVNALLSALMIYPFEWIQGRYSGYLTFGTLFVAWSCMTLGFVGLIALTHATTWSALVTQVPLSSSLLPVCLSMITLGVFIQAGVWPFHKWLMSSLNAPTPVSAIMHGGVVNLGAILFIKLAPLYFAVPALLKTVVLVGAVSALYASIWKLIQSDVKRMLAASTIAQMGFMFIQFGLGLFPAALAHMIWHSVFKAYLFLASPSVLQHQPPIALSKLTVKRMLHAGLCGAFGLIFFVFTVQETISLTDTSLFLALIVLITGTHLALNTAPGLRFGAVLLFSGLYSGSVSLITTWLAPYNLHQPFPLSWLAYGVMIGLLISWMLFLFREKISTKLNYQRYWPSVYTHALNTSQPHPATVTTVRSTYPHKR